MSAGKTVAVLGQGGKPGTSIPMDETPDYLTAASDNSVYLVPDLRSVLYGEGGTCLYHLH